MAVRYNRNLGVYMDDAGNVVNPDGTPINSGSSAIKDSDFSGAMNAAREAGQVITAQRPTQTAAEIASIEAARVADAERARLANVPYGTPVAQGGTANEFEVESISNRRPGDLFAGMGDTSTAFLLDPVTGKRVGPTSTVASNTAPGTTGGLGGTPNGGSANGANYIAPMTLEEQGMYALSQMGQVNPAGTYVSPSAGTALPGAGGGATAGAAQAGFETEADRRRLDAVGNFAVENAARAAAGYAGQGAQASGRSAPQIAEDGSGRAGQQAVADDMANFQANTSGVQGIRGATADTSGADALTRINSMASQMVPGLQNFGSQQTAPGAVPGLQGFRADATGAGALQGFANEQAGPSAAEALLRMQAEKDKATAMSIAKSARGGPAAVSQALRRAQEESARISSDTRMQGAVLRAQETDTQQARRLQALTSAGSLIGEAEGQRLQAQVSAGQILSAADNQKLQSYVKAADVLTQADQQKLGATEAAANIRLQGSELNQRGQVEATQAELEGSAQQVQVLSSRGELSTAIRDADINVLKSNLDATLQQVELNDQQVRHFSQIAEDARSSSVQILADATAKGVDAGTANRILQIEWGKFAWNQLTDIQQADYNERALQAGIIEKAQEREDQQDAMYLQLAGTLLMAAGAAV